MWRSVARRLGAAVLALGSCAAACTAPREPPAQIASPLPPVSGRLAVEGISAPVTIVRDRWGVPHITAETVDDLFFAQGFVQAGDRLFQMDLWRRSAQGRLSEVLGANFIERDAATRRFQYRGNLDVEWASYGPETRRIAQAFTRGINAWVSRARDALPEEFIIAGWSPEPWRAEDLLSRTDAFVASVGAQDEVFLARLVSAIGAARMDAVFPPPAGRTRVAAGVDLGAITYVVGDIIRRVGTPPFFSALAAPTLIQRLPPRAPAGSNAWAIARDTAVSPSVVVAGDPHRPFANPSLRYLVHLTAPGWNVSGATAPWLPGVAIGHNDRVAWTMTASRADTQDLYIERVNPANAHQVAVGTSWVDMVVESEDVRVKGRAEPYTYERLYTRHGAVIGLDRERHLAYTLRWSGTEPGGAAELAALALGQADSHAAFRAALARWAMPPADFVYADVTAMIGHQVAGRIPVRSAGSGRLPNPGWSGSPEWRGWTTLDALPHSLSSPALGGAAAAPRFVVSANESVARGGRIAAVLPRAAAGVDGSKAVQLDTYAWTADRLIPLLDRLSSSDTAVEQARQVLVNWNRVVGFDGAAALYVRWERALRRLLVERRLPAELRDDAIARLDDVVTPLLRPSSAWFDGEPAKARDALLLDALGAAVRDRVGNAGTSTATGTPAVTFAHPLGISGPARQRFNIGPFSVPGYADTIFAASAAGGPSLRVVFDAANWDRSIATNAPGQSGSPVSPHFADLATLWAAGQYFPLPFSPTAVASSAESTLTLVP